MVTSNTKEFLFSLYNIPPEDWHNNFFKHDPSKNRIVLNKEVALIAFSSNIKKKYDPTTLFHMHNHDYLEIILVTSGRGVLFYGKGKQLELVPGTLYLGNYDEFHSHCSLEDETLELLIIDFRPELLFLKSPMTESKNGSLENLIEMFYKYDEDKKPHTLFKEGEFYRAIILFLQIIDKQNDITSQILLFHLLSEIEKRLVHGKTQKTLSLITAQTKSWLAENYANKISIDEIAKKLEISKSQLSRIFKKDTGDSFMQYVTELRLSRAADMLLHTQTSVLMVGIEAGFTSQTAFYRAFQNRYQMSPGEYRSNVVLNPNRKREDLCNKSGSII